MRANIFMTSWIMLQSLFHVIVICCRVIIPSLLGKLTPEKVNRAARIFSKNILNSVRVKYSLINPDNINPCDHKPCIIMCNHASLYDIPLAYATLPGTIRMLAKKELGKIPLFGSAMRHAGVPLIDRKDRRQAIKDLEHAKQLMLDGTILWIYPEGTRSTDGKLQSFKKGGFITAIKANATIIPVGIRGSSNILPTKTFQFRLDQQVEVHVGAPIKASEYTLENKEQLMDKVHQVMLQLLGQDNQDK